jgi:hypothetical protein
LGRQMSNIRAKENSISKSILRAAIH